MTVDGRSVGLHGGRVMVTGAGGDIGRAIAGALAALGSDVCLVGRRAAQLEAAATGVTGRSHVVPADLTRDDDIAALVSSTTSLFGGELDVLVHCAGLYGKGATDTASMATFDELWSANVRGPYQLTQQLLPLLRRRRGHIVFVNSTQGLSASGGVGQFAATQHALRAVADSLRAEVNDDGIRVLTMHVGRTATGRQERIYADDGEPYVPELLLQPADLAQVILSCVTLPRTAEVTTLTIRPAHKSY